MELLLSNILKQLPKEDTSNYRLENYKIFTSLNKTCIVIDDDPTGNQTVYNIPLLTTWDVNTLSSEFKKGTPTFFLLTNSRSLTEKQSTTLYTQIANNIIEASKVTNRDFTLISRSDSTLRGHFSEVNVLKNTLLLQDAITVVIPVMFEGGRVTVNDTHYIKHENTLTPVNETPFSQDHTFGYKHAVLPQWIEEKTQGDVKATDVYTVSLESIRTQNMQALVEEIKNIHSASYTIINALNYHDLDKVTQALLLAEQQGKSIIYRTSSSFVPSYIGLKPQGLLNTEAIIDKENTHGGITIVGSYVPKSSLQLNNALKHFSEETIIEVDVNKVLGASATNYLNNLSATIDKLISNGKDIIVFTSRKLITGSDANTTINIAGKVSNALVTLVKNLQTRPKYLLAKGGITSNDLAIKGLGMKQSTVLGQIEPGIPVWEMGAETKFPNLLYIVFPGNVGNENTLLNITKKLN
ncbi:hypothetical protein KFZ70_04540 [Tamlana fucoidanivorans]|uniref:Hydroxyacid dehydrogenase n=1 Tax=Allotamlana fucoidanivorans TaxID=2583814 RepID=A0A5C4SU14_9FLAO|nr:four-carbon acid sugar kinase family protein [Tamlana fucoidanivorans]TNJ47209.1 hypothetical protein FGF67_01435 [Tamlana fucoidanivorans]